MEESLFCFNYYRNIKKNLNYFVLYGKVDVTIL